MFYNISIFLYILFKSIIFIINVLNSIGVKEAIEDVIPKGVMFPE